MKSLGHRALIIFSIPAILSSVLEPLASIVDTALIGHLGTSALGALAICTVILNSISWMFNFLIHISTQGVAASLSLKDINLYRERIQISLLLSLIIGLLSSFFLYFSRAFAYQLAGAHNHLIPLIDQYFLIRLLGHPFALLYMTLLSILRGREKVALTFKIVTATTTINILATIFFLFFLNWGLRGAALGTVLSYIVGLSLCSFYLFDHSLKISDLFKFKNTTSTWLHFGQNSWAMFGRSAFLTCAIFLSTRYAAKIGPIHLAAHQILLQVWLFSSFFIDGLAMTGNIFGAKYFILKDKKKLSLLARTLLELGAMFGVLFMLIFFFCKQLIFNLFTKDQDVIFILDQTWPLIIGSQIINALAFVYDGLLFGHGSFAFLRRHIFIGVLFCCFPMYYYALKSHTFFWIWFGLCCLNLYRAVSGFFKVRKNIASCP